MRPRTNPLSEQNIKRIDTRPGSPKQTHGFQVYICRQGKVFTKHFSDRAMGGQKKALKAARAYRDELLEKLPPQELIRVSHTRNARNTSGHVGVSFRERTNLKGNTARYICVSVRPERGKGINRSFRYTKANRAEVLAEALAFREDVLAKRLHKETGLSVRKAKALSRKAAEMSAEAVKNNQATAGKRTAKKTAATKKKPAAKTSPVGKTPATRKKTPAAKTAPGAPPKRTVRKAAKRSRK